MSGTPTLRVGIEPASFSQQEEFKLVPRRLYGEGFGEEPLTPNGECLLIRRGEEPVARCSLQVGEGLQGVAGTCGLIGHYEALDQAAGVLALSEACRRLAARGVARVLGPMNGDTWRRYRLALPSQPGDPLEDPAFFPGEPRNPFEYPGHFIAAGFAIAAHYESRIDDDLGTEAPDTERFRREIDRRGITVRALDKTRFLPELRALHDLSLKAFSRNLYYTPIDWVVFRGLYEPVKDLIDPDLVLLAENPEGDLVSFLFTYADHTSISAGQAKRLIAKTVATDPPHRGLGLARHLFDLLADTARYKGYSEILHALAHADNASLKLSARHGGRLFRRYALYQWIP